MARSRGHAKELIEAGDVEIPGGPATPKPSTEVAADDELVVTGPPCRWVNRGAEKLDHALTSWRIDVGGRRALDVGASTGGFTQVLLAHGARHVVALDVGHGQLHPSVAADPRVSDVEGVSVRDLDSLSLDPFDILVADLSFISLTVAMPAMARAVTPEGEVVLLVKPQFEVGRERLGKNGIVSRSRDRALAIGRVVDSAAEHGLGVQGLLPSPISGTHGNREFLLWLHPADGSDMDPSVLTRTIEVVSSAPR
jgi:23S rRNA (cytidine1920-2'-O)/16S rRNA (cytidine1409-2'-O)-methyltransferase